MRRMFVRINHEMLMHWLYLLLALTGTLSLWVSLTRGEVAALLVAEGAARPPLLGTGIAAFLAALGGFGLTARALRLEEPLALLMALAVALIFTRSTLGGLRAYARRSGGPPAPETLPGMAGHVSRAIPAGGVGEVVLETTPPLRYHARSADDAALPRGAAVRVVALGDDALRVTPTDPAG